MTKTLLAFFVCAAMAIGADTAPPPLPRPAGEFSIHLDNGKQVLLSSYKGKVVLLTFFFTTCPHCQHMAGLLQTVQKDYGPKGVQILSGCFDDSAQSQVGQFNEMYVKNAFPVGWDPRAAVFEFLHLSVMQQVFVPILTFVDRKGMIQQQYIGDETYLRDPDKNVRASLDQLLKPTPLISHAKTGNKSGN
jgi:cytochrome oxidase Cu insertion factor (SCO1/SenC/PrrC family)